MATKKINGYVAKLKGQNLYITKNGSALGALGDQSDFFESDQTKFFISKPGREVSRSKFEIRQAIKQGKVISLFNHTLKDKKTLNEDCA